MHTETANGFDKLPAEAHTRERRSGQKGSKEEEKSVEKWFFE